jgi:hypothetical protein
MLYIGYPITYETACKLFNVTEDVVPVIEKTGLKLYTIDKGLCVLCLEIVEVSDHWNTFVFIDEALVYILKYKMKMCDLIKKANIDLSSFIIENMKGEPEHVHNPQPCLMTFG